MNTPGDCAPVRFVFGDISKYFSSKVKLYFSWSFSPQGIDFVIVGVIFSLLLWAWDAQKSFMVSEQGFHGLNNDEKCDFSTYSVFSDFSWTCCDFEILQWIISNVHV